MGSSYGFGGIGKIIGPLGLALIVGSSDIIKPRASVDKIVPAFIYLGVWFLVAGIVYAFLGMETRGRSIDEIDRDLARSRAGSDSVAVPAAVSHRPTPGL